MKLPKNKTLLGFTLVEILVAMAVSSILLLGVIQIFSLSKSTNKINDALSRVQENARYAMDKLLTDIRQSGYVGCTTNLNSFIDLTDAANLDIYDMGNATGGWEYTDDETFPGGDDYVIDSPILTSSTVDLWASNASGNLPGSLSNEVVKGTDVIVVKWADPVIGVYADNNATNTSVLTTTNFHTLAEVADGEIEKGRVVIVGNCEAADAFIAVPSLPTKNITLSRINTATNHISPGNTSDAAPWSQAWIDDAQFMLGNNRVYYIGRATGGGPALFSADYHHGTGAVTRTEIAEGIENMQILYGVDTNGNGRINKYQTAADVNHAQVVAVQLGLIARSLDPVLKAGNERTLEVLGLNVTAPDDRRLRYVFTSTVKIRN